MFNQEIRDMILSDIAKTEQGSTIVQKQNKRLLKLLIVNGIEPTFVKGSIKLSKYKDTVDSLTTLFNAYHSGYTYHFIGCSRKRKISQCVLERVGQIGAVGLVLEGLIKPWELYKTIKSLHFIKSQSNSKAVQELASIIKEDPNQFVVLPAKKTYYPGFPGKREQANRDQAAAVECIKTEEIYAESSSSSSDSYESSF